MSVLRRIQSIVQGHGLRGVGAKALGTALDHAFERRYGIETQAIARLEGLTIRAGNRERATYYEGSRIMPLRGLLIVLRELDASGGALVDLGCGKGKVLLAAAECGLTKARGVEFAHELCEIARMNWRSFQAKSASACDVEIIEADVAAYEFRADETLFFLFNPFDAETLAAVLEHIADSTHAHPRTVFIAVAFLSDHYHRVFAERGDFVLVREVVAWACRFSVYTNAHGPKI
jgi:predicted RNA methylase